MNLISKNILLLSLTALSVIAIASCSNSKRIQQAQNLVINEVMASNRTGLLTSKGKTADWIELKNPTAEPIDLEGFQLAVVKPKKDKAASQDAKNNNAQDDEADTNDEVTDSVMTWEFPAVQIAPGEHLIVFTGKKKKTEAEKQKKKEAKAEAELDDETEKEPKTDKDNSAKGPKDLRATVKLPKEGGTIRILAPNGEIVKELKYGPMAPDQSYALQSDSTYVKTYWQSPGQENTRKGYETANELMDEQRRTSPLLIWELMARAKNSGENWVELKNVSDKEINLAEYRLSKKQGKQEGWQLPNRMLQPGEIITIQLFGKNAKPENTTHAPFKLGASETIVLTKDGKFVDGMCAKPTLPGGSIGRSKDAKGFYYYMPPTKGEENTAKGYRYVSNTPQFNHKPGVYSKNDTLCLRLLDKTRPVHYTLDGSLPTEASPVFPDSLKLTKTSVLRTFVEGDSATLRSKSTSATYVLGVDHDLPVLSITVNRDDLYGYNNGIYAEGPGYSPEWPHKGANYWQKWMKRAHAEFLDGDDGFSVDCGLAIFGGYSRFEPKKSFRLKFLGEYGDQEVSYDFFDTGEPIDLDNLVVRSGSQDWNRCMVRDEFFTSLMKEESPNILTQLYRPIALYVNGEYFGLYYLREKFNKNFVARKLNMPVDSLTVIMSKYCERGSMKSYQDMMSFVNSHDMSDSKNYQYALDNIDLEGLIDYKLGEIFSGNTDVGNIRYVRSTDEGSDKKWHFVFYDLDASWVGYKPTPAYYLNVSGENLAAIRIHNELINRLLNNKDFRELFLQRLSHHMHKTFSPANTTAKFDALVEKIRPEMKLNCKRWPQLSYEQWEKNLGDFRAKFADKPKVVLDGIREVIKITDAENKKYFSDLGY